MPSGLMTCGVGLTEGKDMAEMLSTSTLQFTTSSKCSAQQLRLSVLLESGVPSLAQRVEDAGLLK